jgi:hypothetical protein
MFEVEENKCLAFWDYNNEMSSLLPNTKFSFFLDKNLSEILGDNLKLYGEPFVAYKFHNGEPFWGGKICPDHLEIIDCSLETFLDKVSSE